jgi:hypothetical protein
VKNLKFKMRITPEIGPDKVIAFSKKCPGRENGKTAKLSNGTFLIFGSKASIVEKQRLPATQCRGMKRKSEIVGSVRANPEREASI